jgi:hypothetical protein
MTRRLTAFVTAAAIAALTNAADARQIQYYDKHSIGPAVYQPVYQERKHPGPGRYKKAVKGKKKARRSAVRSVARKSVPAASANIFDRYVETTLPRGSVSLRGVVPELASFARTVVSDCGSKVISAVRNTRVRGSGAISLHASGRAIDVAGNPSCIARHLAAWRGGASNDYHRIRPNHFHISWGGREHGKRFAHYQGRKARRIRLAGR